jgi:hypothetical protein
MDVKSVSMPPLVAPRPAKRAPGQPSPNDDGNRVRTEELEAQHTVRTIGAHAVNNAQGHTTGRHMPATA